MDIDFMKDQKEEIGHEEDRKSSPFLAGLGAGRRRRCTRGQYRPRG
jgi:hypothetical protein